MITCTHKDFRGNFDCSPPTSYEVWKLKLYQCDLCHKWVSLIGRKRKKVNHPQEIEETEKR